MDKSNVNRSSAAMLPDPTVRKTSPSTDLLAKIRPSTSNKPNLVQHLARSTPIQLSSGLKMLSTRIPHSDDPSYQPLVTISDHDSSDEEDFVSPIHKLTKNELREELKIFNQATDSTRHTTRQALLANEDDDDETGDIQFRTHPTIKRYTCCSPYLLSFKDNACTIS